MNNNPLLKTILTGLAIAAFYWYSHRGGNVVQNPPPSGPNITVNDPSSRDVPKWQPPIAPRAPESDSRDTPRQPHEQNAPNTPNPDRHADRESSGPKSHETANGPVRDLEQDEKHHGHTLTRHVGRTDEQLIERLNQERDISSASTYTDKEAAERTAGLALEKNKAKIDAWIAQGPNRGKLAFDYIGDGKTKIGRSIHRGSTQSVPCYNAKVVLIPNGNSFTVLTTYPEGR
jgi:hypothetical protein